LLAARCIEEGTSLADDNPKTFQISKSFLHIPKKYLDTDELDNLSASTFRFGVVAVGAAQQ
jgi:hypothetical protein